MKTITIYRDDMNSELHGNMFDGLLESLGIKTQVLVAGRWIDREIESVDIIVNEKLITVYE